MQAPPCTKLVKKIVLEALGWLLVLVGLAALFLPGPGLLALFAGLALLSTQHEWAHRRVEPVRAAALRGAADSVANPWRIALSVLAIMALVLVGVTWGLQPPAPSWWPVSTRWWLPGGWATGATVILSGVIATATLVYSFLHFRDIRADQPIARQPAPKAGGPRAAAPADVEP